MSKPEFHLMSLEDKYALTKAIIGSLLGLTPDKLGRLLTCFARLQCEDRIAAVRRYDVVLKCYLENLKDGPTKALEACEQRAKQMAEAG